MKVNESSRKHFTFFAYAAVTALALLVRVYFWPKFSPDFYFYFGRYLNVMEKEGWLALSSAHGNTAPPFTLLLFLITLAPFQSIYTLKFIYFLFECCTALIGRLLIKKSGFSEIRAFAVFAALLFAPSVILNGSLWGQSESIYVFFLTACLYSMLQPNRIFRCLSNESLVFLLFGAAFSFKLQSLFFVLALARYIFLKRPHWKSYFWLGAPFVLFSSLFVLAGRPPAEVFQIYLKQPALHHVALSMGAASVYPLLPGLPFSPAWQVGLFVTAVFLILATRYLYRRRPLFQPQLEMQIALFSCIFVAYFLPKMHERYFYPAEIIAILLTFYRFSHWPILLGVLFASTLSCIPYLFRMELVPLPALSFVMGLTLLATANRVCGSLGKTRIG